MKDIPVEILTKFLEAYHNLGYDKTTNFLNNMIGVNYYDLIRKFIIASVCHEFVIKEDELFRGTSKGIRFDALSVYVFFIKKFLKLSHRRLIMQLNKRSKSSITDCLKRIQNLDNKISEHRIILVKIQNIDEKICEQIKILNNN